MLPKPIDFGLLRQETTVLVSEDVYRRVEDLFKFRTLDAVVAKGMTKEPRIFELLGAAT